MGATASSPPPVKKEKPKIKREIEPFEFKPLEPLLIDTEVKDNSVTFMVESKLKKISSKWKPDKDPYARFLPNKDLDEEYMEKKSKEKRTRDEPPPPVLEATEGLTSKDKIMQSKTHGLFSTVFRAFSYHYPLTLKPDHLWQAVLEGFSKHVKVNHEKLREKFVNFKEGKKVIKVRRDEFILGSSQNNWVGVIEEMVGKIREEIPEELYKIVIGKPFSTTTPTEMVVRHLSLMAITSNYFTYFAETQCGIPSITLLGEKKDWIDLRTRIKALESWMVEEFAQLWLPGVLEVVDYCIGSYEGKTDQVFWQAICKYRSSEGSGNGTYVSGWINNFFPYMNRRGTKISPFLCDWQELQKRISEMEFIHQQHQHHQSADGGDSSEDDDDYIDDENPEDDSESDEKETATSEKQQKAKQFFKKKYYGRRVSTFLIDFVSCPMVWQFREIEIPMMLKGGFTGPCLVEETLTPKVAWALVRNEKEHSIA